MPAMSLLPALAKETAVMVTAGAMTPVTVSVEVVRHGSERRELLAARLGAVLHELTITARALQKVVLVVAEAVEDGFLDELRSGLRDITHAVELMAVVSSQLDQAMPVLDATAPSLKVMNSTLTQLNSTIAQLDTLPGVRIARRFVGRPGAAEVF
jgi:hypothetical protein